MAEKGSNATYQFSFRSKNVSKEYFERFVLALLAIYDRGGFAQFLRFAQSTGRILLLIESHGKCHPSQIAKALGMSRPNVALSLKSLEAEGLIKRKVDENNRRQVFISLTPLGEIQEMKLVEPLFHMFKDWLDSMADGGQQIVELLEKSAREMIEETAEGKDPVRIFPSDDKTEKSS